jgi:hypothetical protein
MVNYSGAILPIELSSFTATAKKGDVLLSWNTLSESNSDYFDIQKSENDRPFYSISKVAATGTSTSSKTYNFTDKNVAANSTLLYRLHLVDKDSKSKYSPTVSVKLTNAKVTSVEVFPTYITSEKTLTAKINSETDQTITIQFFNLEGKKISQARQALVAGQNTFTLTPTTDLPRGFLFIRFEGAGIRETVRVMKASK